MRKPAARVVAFSLAFVVSLGLATLVFHGHTSPWLAVLWVLSLFVFALASYDRPPGRRQSLRPSAVALLLFVAAFPVAVRAASLDPNRNQRFPGRHLSVAAYDAFAYQKIFYFLNKWPDRHVETGFHDNQLQKFNRNEKYVYVMILADAFREKFQKADPNGRFYRFSRGYSLFAN